MQWNPDPEEAVVIRCRGDFATGLAPSVAGQRFFRDSARNDIQGELAGWPTGPEYTPHSKGEKAARRAGRVFGVGIPAVLNVAAEVIGGALGSPFGDGESHGSPQEPADEVDDFPVIWADPGTWARTVPWQLDPARRPKGYHVQIVLTDRRLVFLGGAYGNETADVLHNVPRECLVKAEQLTYSPSKSDVRLTFFDGSWIRLHTGSLLDTNRIVAYFNGELRVLRADQLTAAQRAGVDRFVADQREPITYPPILTAIAEGYLRVDVTSPTKDGTITSHGAYFDPNGNRGLPTSLR